MARSEYMKGNVTAGRLKIALVRIRDSNLLFLFKQEIHGSIQLEQLHRFSGALPTETLCFNFLHFRKILRLSRDWIADIFQDVDSWLDPVIRLDNAFLLLNWLIYTYFQDWKSFQVVFINAKSLFFLNP